MLPTRILMVDMPQLLSGLVDEVVAGEAGLAIVGHITLTGALSALPAWRPDLVVLGADDEPQAAKALALLRARHPQLRVVSLDASGRTATGHEPGEPPQRVTGVSPAMLLALLRGVADGARHVRMERSW